MMDLHSVAEGDSRKVTMDFDERVQCNHDIESWFQRKASHDSAKEKHTSFRENARNVLRILLIAQGGNIWFDDYKSLSVDVRLSLLICRFVYDEKYCIVAI
ncbi:uncharacterized protein PHALS_00423 [Plasmopara halstedii]|uniref:Uncharacterized protein n=1 Tax=Plasmopara halstedii TaxID=4781 RepID=A0A0P1A699_PLAHL|nr:uncharacterized protein PHALS_00423 [Plasmopara halstedii]CEG36104.1 hypothetical protein PHALS_00423 [Plasmopara halstedii]|eukprot:XP_024572473.1 hypothetical protein PHALS_00423 [Plasmopara halstedii]